MTLLQLADMAPATFQLPQQASTQAVPVDDLYMWIYWLCVILFVLIVVVMAVFSFAYRRQPGVQADQTHTHNLALEMAWTIPPTIIAVFLFWWGFEGFMELRTPPADAYKIEVTAEKWKWTFRYPNGAEISTSSGEIEEMYKADLAENGRAATAAMPIEGGLHVWKGQPFVLVMTSKDVLHSFYVPDFRVKQDVVPGRYTTVWFTPQKDASSGATNVHRVYCTEFCGTDHSQMWSQVVVHETKEDFEAWLKAAKKSVWEGVKEEFVKANPDAEFDVKDPAYLIAVGEAFYAKQCLSCHSTTPGDRKIGPSFADLAKMFGKSRPLESGSADLSTNEKFLAYVTTSLQDPNSELAEGFLPGMTAGLWESIESEAPESGLGFKAMAAYIRSLAKE